MRREETKKNENKKEPIVVEPYVNDILNRTSELIGTKYRASVLEHQVSYLAQLKAQHKEYREENGELIVELTAAEIRKKTGKKGGSLYNDLAVVANSMTTSNMGYMDDENERFAFMSLVNFATYEKGKLRIYYPMRVKIFFQIVIPYINLQNFLNAFQNSYLQKKTYAQPCQV